MTRFLARRLLNYIVLLGIASFLTFTLTSLTFEPLDSLLEDGGYLSKPPFEPLEETKFYDFRRLFYTAFSRAQNLLVLTTQERSGRGQSSAPSKYLLRRLAASRSDSPYLS